MLTSVLLPFFNAEATIGAALASLRRQSLPRFEVLAVDDGSTDSSADVVRQVARRDARFKLISQPHQGLVPALNAGLERCRGELVARMDADDISLRRRLELQHRVMEQHPEVGVVGCLVKVVPRRGITDGMARYERWLNAASSARQIKRELFVESPLCHPGVTLRRRALQQVGGYRDQGWAEDHDLWLRLDAAGVEMTKVAETLLLWRDGPHRLTRTAAPYAKERFYELKLHHLRQRLEGRRVELWGAGMEGKAWLRRLAPLGLLSGRVVDVDPRKLGQTIHGCEVIPPQRLGPPSPDRLVLVAVGAPGARKLIRAFLVERGYQETAQFICVA